MTRWVVGMAGALALAGCETTERTIIGPGSGPDAPRALQVGYYAGVVTVTWELGPAWDGESFRVYSKRNTDPDYFLIAEVTSCVSGFCSYSDLNIEAGRTYDYYVAAVDAAGFETATAEAIRIDVPHPVPPPVPSGTEVVALDDATFVRWSANAREASDFAFYRVYLVFEGESFLLGETDSEGFVDLLAQNGLTYRYFVTSVDGQGHESEGSVAAEGTPRPDYHGEALWDFFARPELSGFVFRSTEAENPIVDGGDPSRHFRLETDVDGWWLVPGPGVTVHPSGFETTALRCGVASDAGCLALNVAPSSGYVATDLFLLPETTYVLSLPAPGGQVRYAAVRISILGFDQNGDALAIFDWAHQLQPGNPNLAPLTPTPVRIR